MTPSPLPLMSPHTGGTSPYVCTRPATRGRCRRCRWTAASSASTSSQWRSSGGSSGCAELRWGRAGTRCAQLGLVEARGPVSCKLTDQASATWCRAGYCQCSKQQWPGLLLRLCPAGPRRTTRCSCAPWQQRAPRQPAGTMQRGMRCWPRGSSWCVGRMHGGNVWLWESGAECRSGREQPAWWNRAQWLCGSSWPQARSITASVLSCVPLQVGSCRNDEDQQRIAKLKGEATLAGLACLHVLAVDHTGSSLQAPAGLLCGCAQLLTLPHLACRQSR